VPSRVLTTTLCDVDHRILIDMWNNGLIARLRDVPESDTEAASLTSWISNAAAAFMLLQGSLMSFLFLAVCFFVAVPTAIAHIRGYASGYIYEPVYSANWTIARDSANCFTKGLVVDGVVGYDNITEAEELCLSLGGACAAVGSTVCSADGPFYLCDSEWRRVSVEGPSCVASPPNKRALDWLNDPTDEYPIHPVFVLGIPSAVFGPAFFMFWLLPTL
jgi:hypothetical protein